MGEADRGPWVPSTACLCGPRTVCAHHDTLDGWLNMPDTLPWASQFLILPSPPLFLEEVKQIVPPMEVAFSFSIGYLWENLVNLWVITALKNHLKKEKVNRAFLILSFEFKCQLLFNLQVLFTDPWGSPRPFQGIYKAKMVLIILPNCSLPFSLGWYLHWWHRAAAGKDAGTQIGIKAWLPTVPAGSVSLFFSVTVPAQYQKRRKGRFSCW